MKSKALSLLAGVAILASCSPTEYKIERNVTIDAPKELVFEQVNNHKLRDAWSPWEAMDPDMSKTYEGPESGVGAIYKWTGNDSVGTGSLEIIESIPNEYIKSKLVFTEPWQSESTIEWKFEEAENGTMASWSITGELPGYLFWMGQEDMEESMAPDFEKGLAQLKAISEKKAAEKPAIPTALIDIEAKPYYYIEGETKISEMESSFFGDKYGEIMTYLGEDSKNMLNMPMAFYKTWDEENDRAVVEVAIACESTKPEKGNIKKAMSPAGKAVKCTYMGPYEGSGEAHEVAGAYITANNLEMAGSPFEIYVTDPGMEPDTSKWITEIYYPVTEKKTM